MHRQRLVMALIGLNTLAVAMAAATGGSTALSDGLQPKPALEQSTPETAPVAVPEPTPKVVKYHRGNMVLWGVSIVWGIAVPAAFLFTGFSARLRDAAHHIGHVWFFSVGIYVCLLAALFWVLSLPIDFYQGFVREHAFGLSTQTFGKWLGDALKSLMVVMVLGFALAWLPYLLLRASPARWWLVTSVLAVPVFAMLVVIEPVWIAPLFNKFGPMKNKALESELLALADRAGIEGGRVFEVDKSVDTKTLNAYVAGLLGTKRIVLWDTLIAKLDRDQILFVMGHEMGHYVLGHVWQILAALCLVTTATLYLIHRAAAWMISWFKLQFGFNALHDVASLPLFVLFFNVTFLLLMPLVNVYSRHLEREADRFGLELTRNNHAAATSFVTLASDNLVYPRPGLVHTIWRASHPPLADRIEFCNNYAPWRTGQPLRYADRFRPAPEER